MSILPKPSSDSSVRPGWDSSRTVVAKLAVVANVAELEVAANAAKMKAMVAIFFIVY